MKQSLFVVALIFPSFLFAQRIVKYDIQEAAAKIAGKDLTDFFNNYVLGKNLFAMESYLAKAGLQLDTFVEEVYIGKMENCSEAQLKMSKQLFGIK